MPHDNYSFSRSVIDWYLKNKRDLPWRETRDPYKIWVSEIILQQTRVAQGLSYYLRFIDRFPSVVDLANASEDEVLLLWQGLGYYSRARNMHHAARTIVDTHHGVFPQSYKEIRELKGIGDYTAAAIASFAFDLPHATLDGNVFRVLARHFAIETPINSTEGKKSFSELAQSLLNPSKAALHNQAMMDLGATVCTPISPSCDACPLASSCGALDSDAQEHFPVKENKAKQTDRYFLYIKVCDKGSTYLHKRAPGDIWQGLYEFPLIELDAAIDTESQQWCDLIQQSGTFRVHSFNRCLGPYTHVLSHQKLHVWFAEIEGSIADTQHTFVKTKESELENFPISRLTEKLLEKE